MENMKSYIGKDVLEHLKYYFDLIYSQQLDLHINGVFAFNPKSQFVEGKVINACSYVYESTPIDAPNKKIVGQQLTEIIDLMAAREFKTWGMLNCIIALHRLNQTQQLTEVVSEKSLALLKQKLDWRTFVNEDDLSLISFPANFYGVAFGIAKYRELLGFETGNWSDKLLEKLLTHVDNFSGQFGSMDETKGQGRFDRYSILIPAEICNMLSNTGCEVPEKLKVMLRKSCDIYMSIANTEGTGFSYGRSIGAYGDTAALEVFSIAAKLGLLTEDELEIAYAYNTMAVKRFVDFWIDSETRSLNMWAKGRKTDKYRNINRILGENLSLAMQIIGAFENWNAAGFKKRNIISGFEDKLASLPRFSKFNFSEDTYARRLYTIRDKKHVFMLPLINGGDTYYKETSYLPIPNEFGVLSSPTNSSFPFLTPQLIFKDGRVAMPVVYIKNISDNLQEKNVLEHKVHYDLSAMVLIADDAPQKLEGITGKVSYQFSAGQIKFELVLSFHEINKNELDSVVMQFGSFSSDPVFKNNSVHYKQGDIKRIDVAGFDECKLEQVAANKQYHTPVGAINNLATFSLKQALKTPLENKVLHFSWALNYS